MTVGTGAQLRLTEPPAYSAWTIVGTNLATDPRANFWVSAPGTYGWGTDRWAGPAPSAATYTLVPSAPGDGPLPGLYSYARKTWTIATSGPGANGDTGFPNTPQGVNAFPVTPGEVYTVSSYLRASSKKNFEVGVYLLNSAGTEIATRLRSTVVSNIPGSWNRISLTFTVPSGVGRIHIVSDVSSNSSNGATAWAVGDTLDGTGLLIEKSPTLNPYYDGNTPNQTLSEYTWSGTPNASTTIQRGRTLLSSGPVPEWNIADYSVVEDATPLDPSDQTGGFGQIKVTIPTSPETRRLMNAELSLTDGALGETVGTIRGLDGGTLAADLTANSRIGNLAVERTCQPFIGTLGDGIEYYLSLCGITSAIVIDDEFYATNVRLPGGRVNVYDRLRKMGAAYNFDLSLVSNNVVIRRPRERMAVNYRDAGVTWTYDQSSLAQSVRGYYYNSSSGTQIAYPPLGVLADAQVYQVDAGETQVFEIPMSASLSFVEQPACVTFVAEGDMTASQYAVSTSEGEVISPTEWISRGGSVVASIAEDTTTLIITIHGADIADKAPFRIAVPTGENQYYSSLRIRGTGVFWEKKLFTLETGLDPDLAPDELGVEVDNEFMETFDQLYHRLLLTAARYGTDRQVIRVSSGGINRIGVSDSARYPTIGTVKALYAGATIASIQTELGPTIADWNAELLAYVNSEFENQAFGNVAGARVRQDHSYYRIRSVTIRPRSVDYTAERDNTIGDVYRTGETIAQWNSRWSGRIIRDVNIAPLAT